MTNNQTKSIRRRGAALLATVSGLALLLAAGAAQAATTIDNGTQTVPTDHPSPWNIDTGLSIGPTGTGELDIITGGDTTLTNPNTCGTIYLGFNASGKGTLKVDGAGSTLDNAGCGVTAGWAGQGTILVTNGGVLTSGANSSGNTLAANVNSVGTVTINGAGSTWNYSSLNVGGQGVGTLNVTNGGLLNNTGCVNVSVGSGPAGHGTVNVSGAGSHWMVGNSGAGCGVYLGDSGDGTLNVTGGGKVDGVLQFVLGNNFAPSKGTLNIDGVGSTVSTSGLVIGQNSGSIGILTITNGGVLTSTNGGTLGAGGTGSATIDGAGSQWINNFAGVGVGQSGNGTLTITNGGVVTGASAYIGGNNTTNSALIDGAGSKWTSTGAWNAGAAGSTSTVTVSNGGLLSDNFAVVGQGNNSVTNITVTGAGSTWTNLSTLGMGSGGSSNFQLNILAGGTVSDSTADLQRGIVTVDGSGSVWTNTGNVRVGSSGTGTVVVRNGGLLSAGGGANTITLGQGSSSTGIFAIGAIAANAAAPSGTVQASAIILGTGNGSQGTMVFNHTDSSYNFSIPISGPGGVQFLSGTTNVQSANTYTGATTIGPGGRLNLIGSLANTAVTVQNNGTLLGSGSLVGTVTVQSGGILRLQTGSTLTTGALTLNSGSNVLAFFGSQNLTALGQVNGALVLDGTLNIVNAGGFGPGVYRLLSYTGALTDNGLDIGTVPAGVDPTKLSIQTGIAGQVNLAYSSAGLLQYWNGAVTSPNGSVNGGTGTWNVTTTNWTNSGGNASSTWATDGFAIFQGAAGTVTISNAGGAVTANGAQFVVGGYTVGGETLTLTGATPTVRVGDGTSAGNFMTATISAPIAGTGGLIKTDFGTLVLSGVNTYTGTTTINVGTLSVTANSGLGANANPITLNGGILKTNGGFIMSRVFTVAAGNGALDAAGPTQLNGGSFDGPGQFTKVGAGAFYINVGGNYSGNMVINGGSIYVNGALGAANIQVQSGALLGGSGSVGGPVVVQSFGILLGQHGMTFTSGNLTFQPNAILLLDNTSAPSATTLFQVNGNLVLDGKLNVSASPGFGPGLYRLFDYTGALTNNTMDVNTVPAGVTASDLTIQTSVGGQVNLIYAAPAAFTFWNGSIIAADGTVHGGAGTWKVGTTNWTNAGGTSSGAWTNDQFAIFAAPGGAVTVDTSGGALSAGGMQFAANGYSMSGGPITLTGATPTLRVGDGTAGGVNYTATISAPLGGSSGLIKTDLGTLVLSGANTVTGGVTINGGVLSISADNNLGGAGGGVTLNGGTLRTTQAGSISSNRIVTVGASGGGLDIQSGALLLSGALNGSGALTKTGGGQIQVSGGGAYAGAVDIKAGAIFFNTVIGNASVLVESGAITGGDGSIGGAIVVQNGGSLSGRNSSTFTTGAMTLSSASNVNVSLGAPSTNAAFHVNGALVLDGTLNVSNGGGFGPGLYRLFDYTGGLTDNGLAIGSVPAGTTLSDLSVQTSVAGQINLIYSAGPIQFWDGSHTTGNGVIDAGSGTWKLGTTNWTDPAGATNGTWSNGTLAIFTPPGGTVTIDNSGGAVSASSIQFASNGYTLTGSALTLTGAAPIIRVGNGTAGSSGFTAVINASIAGAGTLTKTDAGELVLSGANTFAGGVDIQGGLLTISADNNLGAAGGGIVFNGGAMTVNGSFATARSVSVQNFSTLDISAGQTLDLTGALNGSSQLYKSGAGTLVIDGAGAFTGAMNVTGGTLTVNGTLPGASVSIGFGATLGGTGTINGAVTMSDGSHLVGVQGQALNMGPLLLADTTNLDVTLGAPSNTALFSVHGGLTLDGHLNITDGGGFGLGVYRVMDYTGALTNNGLTVGTVPAGVNPGNLSVQTAVAGQVNLVFSALAPIQFWNGSHTSPNGAVNGGAGTWVLGSTNWTDANGSSSAAWSGQDAVFMGAGGVVTIDNSGGAVSANSIQFATNGYSVTGGALFLTGAPTTIRVGDGTAAGSNLSAVVVSSLTGSGGLIKTDLGTLSLTGVNTFTGGLAIQQGSLSVGADGNLGATGGGLNLAGGTLQIASGFATGRTVTVSASSLINVPTANTLDLTGALTGGSNLTKGGAGTLRISGNSSGFGAIVGVSGGILQVDGTLGGQVSVNSGARLKGIGQVGTTSINAAGTLAPGNSIGTLNVAGNLTLATGSIYEVELNAAGQSDLTHATGTGTIQAGAIMTAQPSPSTSYVLGTHYTVITADGGRTGTFGTFNGATLAQPFLQLTPAYDATHVFIDVTRNAASFCSVAATANQCAAAGGAESLGQGNVVYNAIANLPDAASARVAFDGLSGEAHASVRGMVTDDSRFVRDATTLRLGAADPDGHAGWGQVFGASGSTDGDGNAAKFTRSTGGFLVGGDWAASDTTRLGVLGGWSHSNFKVGDRASSGDVDSYVLGAYGGHRAGAWRFTFGAAYAWHDIGMDRHSAFGGMPSSSERATTGQLFGEASFRMGSETSSLSPFAGLALVSTRAGDFTETGGATALKGVEGTTQTTFATLGLRAAMTRSTSTGEMTLKGTLAWRGATGDTSPDARLAFASGGSAFTVQGAPLGDNTLVVGADLGVTMGARTRASITYDGQFASGASDQSLKATLTIAF